MCRFSSSWCWTARRKKNKARIVWFGVTQGYSTGTSAETEEETGDLDKIQAVVECIVSHFRKTLEAKGVDLTNVQNEHEEVVKCARKWYWGLPTDLVQLHAAPVADSNWLYQLQLSQLIFSMPFSNGPVKQFLSSSSKKKKKKQTK